MRYVSAGTGEMRSHVVQTDESDGDELRGRGRSGVRQRSPVVQEVLVPDPAVRALAPVRHVLRHVQRVHRHNCQQLPATVLVSHERGRRGHPVLHRRVARAARAAQLRAQPQVPGTGVHGGQPADGRRSGHHVLLSAERHRTRVGQAARGVTGHVPDFLLSDRVRHGSHRRGE